MKLNNRTVVHISMLIFGGYSAMNIALFFTSIGHPWIVAGLLGVALGIGLLAASIYLSRQDYKDWVPFSLLLVAVCSLAFLSGQIQYLAYLTHAETMNYALFLGFAPPFIVELGLALAVSFAEKSEAKKMQRDSKEQIQGRIADAMTEIFSTLDTSKIKKQIEKQVDLVIFEQVQVAISELLPKKAEQRKHTNTEQTEQSIEQTEQRKNTKTEQLNTRTEQAEQPIEQQNTKTEQETEHTVYSVPVQSKAEQLNTNRNEQKKKELVRFAQYLAQNHNGEHTEELNRTQLGKDFGCSHTTVNRYIKELQQADIINGHIDATLIAQM